MSHKLATIFFGTLLIVAGALAQPTSLDSLRSKWDAELARMKKASSYDQSRESLLASFGWLRILDLHQAIIAFDSANSRIVNTRRTDLDRSHPLYVQGELEGDDILLIQTKLAPFAPRDMFVLFTQGPSGDPAFYFIDPAKPDSIWALISGTALALPGNGTAYVAGRADRTFTERHKYVYSQSGFQSVHQPFLYVGLKTRTLKPIKLLAKPESNQIVAELPQDSPVEVLIADQEHAEKNHTLLLIRTPFGLLGWLSVEYTQYYSDVIEGISFWGD